LGQRKGQKKRAFSATIICANTPYKKFIYNNSRISDLKKHYKNITKKFFSMYMKDLWHTFLKKDHANFTGFSQGEKRKPFFKKNWQ
jgi:hypothetical protein